MADMAENTEERLEN